MRRRHSSIVQRRGYKNAGRAAVRQRMKIVGMTHAARAIDSATVGAPDNLPKPRDVRPIAAAHARKSHDNHSRRPERRLLEDLGIAQKARVLKIQRQNTLARRCQGAKFLERGKTFAAQRQPHIVLVAPGQCVDTTPYAGIDPKLERGEAFGDGVDRRTIIVPPFDGVEIGDIERIERLKTDEVARRLDWRDGGRQSGDKRAIIGATAGDGAHHDAVSNINDGNDPHEAL